MNNNYMYFIETSPWKSYRRFVIHYGPLNEGLFYKKTLETFLINPFLTFNIEKVKRFLQSKISELHSVQLEHIQENSISAENYYSHDYEYTVKNYLLRNVSIKLINDYIYVHNETEISDVSKFLEEALNDYIKQFTT